MTTSEANLKSTRRAARALVLQILFEIDVSRHTAGETLHSHLSENEFDEASEGFIRRLVTGTMAQKATVDALIAEAAPEWPVSTMAAVDRNILRMAIYELRFDGSTPLEIVINEAVELGHRFGSESSARFINGVLGTLAGKPKNDQP